MELALFVVGIHVIFHIQHRLSNMKKTIFFFLIAAFTAQAQNNTLLWKITGKGLEKPSYLFGTMHLICSSDFNISESLKKSIGESEQVVMELDMDDPSMMNSMQQIMFMKDGKTLKNVLNETDYLAVNQYFKDTLKMGLEFFGAVKPALLVSLMYAKLFGCEPQSYEMSFVQMAQSQRKEILGLESFAEQGSIFDSIPYKLQAEQLVEMIHNIPKARAELMKGVDLYKKQDLEGLNRWSQDEEFGFKEYEGMLLNNRNKNWISKIDKYVKQKPTFIAVGAAHLGGQNGVISLLKKQGFKVEPVR